MTKDEAKAWLADFMLRIETQDNRGTAKPIQFLLQTKREYAVHAEHSSYSVNTYRHPVMEDRGCNTYADAVRFLESYGFKGLELEREKEEIEKVSIGHYWDTTQSFLTENGMNQHIELNGHNLGEYRSFVIHSFRNPELKELFNAIMELLK